MNNCSHCPLAEVCYARELDGEVEGCSQGMREFISPEGNFFKKAYITHAVAKKVLTIIKKMDKQMDRLRFIDTNKLNQTLVVATYSGKYPRNQLKDIDIWIADIGQVGKTFADVYLKDCLTDPDKKPHPIRFKVEHGRVWRII